KYTGQYKDHEANGKWTYWHLNGAVEEEVVWNMGKYSGKAHVYHDNGRLYYTGDHDRRGLRQGLHQWFHKNGKPEIKGKYIDGLEQGEFRYYKEDGSLDHIIV